METHDRTGPLERSRFSSRARVWRYG
jgi:hypothetical protein